MSTLLDIWRHEVTENGADLVLPDGCRDLIVVIKPGTAPTAFVSELHSAPVLATGFPRGTRLTGYRLAPGTRIETGPLLSRVVHGADDPASRLSLLEEHCTRDADIIEAFADIEASPVTTAADLARRLSITPRTLQRLFSANRLPAPGFWLRLARARRAAVRLRCGDSLADIAADAGYADQAHMTRAFRNWFGTTPARLKSDPYRLSLLAQSGLAVPATGEQISTR